MITEDYLSVIFCFSNTLNTRVSEERIHKSEWNVSVTAPETESKCLEGKITWERNETLLIDINMTLQAEHACSGNDWQTEGAFSAGTACILLQIMHAPNKSKPILKSKTLSCAFTNNRFTLPLLFSPFATFCSIAKSEWVMFCADTLTWLQFFIWASNLNNRLLSDLITRLSILIGQSWSSAVKYCCIIMLNRINDHCFHTTHFQLSLFLDYKIIWTQNNISCSFICLFGR